MPLQTDIQEHPLTAHAAIRVQQRSISPDALGMVLAYGRKIRARGATFRVIGNKEVDQFAARGIDLRDANGIHVLLGLDGAVITAYRNHNLRKIRPAKRRRARVQ